MKSSSDLKLVAKFLLDRLERISADSPWAHQASGIRSALSKKLSSGDYEEEDLKTLIQTGFQILENAAGEIPNYFTRIILI